MRKKAHAEKAANHERWLLTYADLITLLLVFFVVMYAMSNADMTKFGRLAGSVRDAFNVGVLQGSGGAAPQGSSGGGASGATSSVNLINSLLSGLKADVVALVKQDKNASPDSGSVGVTLDQEGVTVTIAGGLLFDSGKATIKSDALPLLTAVAGRIRTLPNEVRVEGHTDNIPIQTALYGSNWDLSAARSVAVVRFFHEHGVDPARLSAVGYGEYRPVADNASREGRADNRRVNITIVFKTVRPTSPGFESEEAPDQSGGTHEEN